MRIQKPHSSENRKLKEVDVDLRWVSWPSPHFYPTRIYYPLGDGNDPEQVQEYKEFDIQEIVGDHESADADLGVAGRMFIVDILVSEDKTERTVLWFDEEKFMVEAKVKPPPR